MLALPLGTMHSAEGGQGGILPSWYPMRGDEGELLAGAGRRRLHSSLVVSPGACDECWLLAKR